MEILGSDYRSPENKRKVVMKVVTPHNHVLYVWVFYIYFSNLGIYILYVFGTCNLSNMPTNFLLNHD